MITEIILEDHADEIDGPINIIRVCRTETTVEADVYQVEHVRESKSGYEVLKSWTIVVPGPVERDEVAMKEMREHLHQAETGTSE